MMKMDRSPVVALIVPCYREEEVLAATTRELLLTLSSLRSRGLAAEGSFIVYVDDRSDDSTWNVVCSLACADVKGIRLSRHCGHQEALLAGMEYAVGKSDVCITLDADLQDDVGVIPEMLERYLEGNDIVFGVRRSRPSDTWLKRATASAFYHAMARAGVDCVGNHADFRLMSRRAVADLLEYGERNLFLRGIVPRLGYAQAQVRYDRGVRKAGESKYPLPKMLDFAIDGITSFSVRPVRMLFWLGMLFLLTALAIGIYVIARHFSGDTIEGWTSLMLSIWFCTGVLLVGMGIVGEYIGKIYIEVKRRPRYRISDTV